MIKVIRPVDFLKSSGGENSSSNRSTSKNWYLVVTFFPSELSLHIILRPRQTMEQIRKHKELEAGYEYYQTKLFPFAYNVIGDTQEAEDVVQEILNNHFLFPNAEVVNQENYLIRSVVNRSINAKKRLKIRRREYNGQWLPVPLKTEENLYAELDSRNILDYSLLVLLERLSPKERAVFILKESFAYSHSEIGEMLKCSEENSRQLYRRGKKKLGDMKPTPSKRVGDTPVRQLSEAILARDLEKVKALLTENIQSLSDGGYNMRTARNIISGKHDVGRFLLALYDKYFLQGTEVSFTTINHDPAILFMTHGQVYRCMTFQLADGLIEAVYIVINPDKLRALQPK
jgi:RNA polymerase sigma factor (sigma-70 family)